MADVNKYLADIKEAVYGEEVRSSIHDAIDVINKEVVNYNAVVTEKSEAAAESAQSAESAVKSAVNAQNEAKAASDTAAVKAAEAAESADNAAVQAINAKTEADRAKSEADKAASIVSIDVAKLDKAGIVKPDGKTITIDPDGTIHSLSTLNYNDMENKPTINGFEMNGNAELEDIGVYTDIQTFINGVFSGFLGRNFSFMENMSPDEYFMEIRSAYPNQTINLFIQKQDDTLFNALPVQNSCILTTCMTDMAGYAQAFDCKTKDIYIFSWYDLDGYPMGGSWKKMNETVDMDSSKALNTFAGKRVAESCTGEDTKQQNVVMGYAAGNGLENSQTGNTYLGTLAGGNAAGSYNTAVGDCAFSGNYKDATFSKSTGSYNTAVGHSALNKNTEGVYNTGVGAGALLANTTGVWNTAVGNDALNQNDTGSYNTALGNSALFSNTQGKGNVALGDKTLSYCNSDYNTAVGDKALYDSYYSYCTGIGYNSEVTGDNQIQLGTSNESVYCYGSVQNRSDARDKIDIKDTDLGLDFIKALRPVKFRWNYRGAYKELDEKGNIVIHENDGSKSGKRYHDGLIAQEVKKVMDEMGVEFAGYQDHKINGGEDVLSIGYTELISPLIKAIQELDNEIRELKDFIAK